MKLKSKGMTFFISTHNFYEIRQFANWYVLIKNGKITSVSDKQPNISTTVSKIKEGGDSYV
jgi:ABC-type multidrug transport system ATPase subunit